MQTSGGGQAGRPTAQNATFGCYEQTNKQIALACDQMNSLILHRPTHIMNTNFE